MPWTARSGLSSVFRHRGAGILIDPLLDLGSAETKELQNFAEFSIVMIPILIGLELEPRAL